jgi:hypothetical protein
VSGCGGIGGIVARAAGIVSSCRAEAVAVFRYKAMFGEELEAVTDGTLSVLISASGNCTCPLRFPRLSSLALCPCCP